VGGLRAILDKCLYFEATRFFHSHNQYRSAKCTAAGLVVVPMFALGSGQVVSRCDGEPGDVGSSLVLGTRRLQRHVCRI